MADCQLLRRVDVISDLRTTSGNRPHKGGLSHVWRAHENDRRLVQIDARSFQDGLLSTTELLEDRLVASDQVEHRLNTLVCDESGEPAPLSLPASFGPHHSFLVNAQAHCLQARQNLPKRHSFFIEVMRQGKLHAQTLEGMQSLDELWIRQDPLEFSADVIPNKDHPLEAIFAIALPDILDGGVDFDPSLKSELLPALIDELHGWRQLVDQLDLSQRAEDRLVCVVVDGVLAESATHAIIHCSLLWVAEPSEGLLCLHELFCCFGRRIDIRMRLTDRAFVGCSNLILRGKSVDAKKLIEVRTSRHVFGQPNSRLLFLCVSAEGAHGSSASSSTTPGQQALSCQSGD
mmetsp:Transcript_51459/g.83450  ORF Transcript_51459/g.83450 Transcript_51459/m.83450 type:complete len:346 (+) Transcript_51459:614-1651(+)